MSDLERIRADKVIGRRAPVVDPVVAAVRERWAAVVGEDVARHAAPVRMSAGSLVVACSSSSWSAELTLLAPAVAARLQADLGLELALRFEVGELPEAAAAAHRPAVRRAPAADAPEHARELAAAVASEELRASLERAIARTLRD